MTIMTLLKSTWKQLDNQDIRVTSIISLFCDSKINVDAYAVCKAFGIIYLHNPSPIVTITE